jgi:CO/xanthine dehydrogenase Mo-binding subunit
LPNRAHDLLNHQGVAQELSALLDIEYKSPVDMYKIPTSKDIPEEIIPIVVETPQPDGPFGARGIGEHTMIPCAPMIGNAVKNGLGVRIKSMHLNAQMIAGF